MMHAEAEQFFAKQLIARGWTPRAAGASGSNLADHFLGADIEHHPQIARDIIAALAIFLGDKLVAPARPLAHYVDCTKANLELTERKADLIIDALLYVGVGHEAPDPEELALAEEVTAAKIRAFGDDSDAQDAIDSRGDADRDDAAACAA